MIENFGPKKRKALRQRWVDSGNISRKYAHRLTNETRAVFNWGVAEKLVKAEIVVALKAVAPLCGGEVAYELDDRKAVHLEVVRATAKFLSPVVKAPQDRVSFIDHFFSILHLTNPIKTVS